MTTPPTDPHAPDYRRKWWVLLSVAMGVFLSTIDGSIVNVALPTLQEALQTNFATVQWVVVAYLLVTTSLMLGVARLGDMIGKKRIYMTGMVIFTTASLGCGLAPSIEFLIAVRLVQGLGAVMLAALGTAIVTEAFPPTERGRALGIMGTVVSLGISLGPTLGGVLIGAVNWHAIFLVNLPVGIIGFLLVRRFVPDRRPPGGQRFDALGAVLLLGTLLALSRTFGQVTGVPLAGAIFASRVFDVTGIPTSADVSEAAPWAIVEGVEAVFLAAAILIAGAVLLGAVGYARSRRLAAQRTRSSAPAEG